MSLNFPDAQWWEIIDFQLAGCSLAKAAQDEGAGLTFGFVQLLEAPLGFFPSYSQLL